MEIGVILFALPITMYTICLTTGQFTVELGQSDANRIGIATLENHLSLVWEKIKLLERQLKEEVSKREALEQQIDEGSGRIAEVLNLRREFSPDSPVAFAVSNPLTDTGTLKFQTIITNYGNDYSTTTGQFTCPLKGLYLFAYNVQGDELKEGQDQVTAVLKIDGTSKWYVHCDNRNVKENDLMCGGTAILFCDSNSKVEVVKSSNGKIEKSSYTWFTGYLIQSL